jgi:hypothetical protein
MKNPLDGPYETFKIHFCCLDEANKNKTYNKSFKPALTRVTLFAERANPAPCYGGLVLPSYPETNRQQQ